MIRRLLALLLIACLAAPALGAPMNHEATFSAAQQAGPCASHDAGHAQKEDGRFDKGEQSAPAKHDCIGCIAPLSAAPAPAGATLLPVERLRPHGDLRLHPLTSWPETPPPRA